jgi:hypothetical protein
VVRLGFVKVFLQTLFPLFLLLQCTGSLVTLDGEVITTVVDVSNSDLEAELEEPCE